MYGREHVSILNQTANIAVTADMPAAKVNRVMTASARMLRRRVMMIISAMACASISIRTTSIAAAADMPVVRDFIAKA